MEKPNAETNVQVRRVMLDSSCEVPASAGCAGDLLDVRQDGHAQVRPSTETDNSMMALPCLPNATAWRRRWIAVWQAATLTAQEAK
jgi:hypothetical protein